MRVLLVEDDDLLGRATQLGLEQDSYVVDWVRNGDQVSAAVKTHAYAAILLDLGLPGKDGMSVLNSIRSFGYKGPVLIVTARGQVSDKVLGLDSGADDFIVKPFDFDELSARLRVAVRRSAGRPDNKILISGVSVDITRRQVRRDNDLINLTSREFTLLLDLIDHVGHVRSRSQLEECLYGWGEEIESNSVEVHIHHLRKKLGKQFIKTVHGVGYIIEPQVQ